MYKFATSPTLKMYLWHREKASQSVGFSRKGDTYMLKAFIMRFVLDS